MVKQVRMEWRWVDCDRIVNKVGWWWFYKNHCKNSNVDVLL